MSDPFIGEIRMFAGNFAPLGWEFCEGQLLAISGNDALFSLLGTTYGGDGRTTFALPDMRGRIPLHAGSGPGLSNRQLGAKGGVETVTLTVEQMPLHSHAKSSGNSATRGDPGGHVIGDTGPTAIYGPNPNAAMDQSADKQVGGNQPHTNLMPFQCVNFIIALFGIFPSRN